MSKTEDKQFMQLALKEAAKGVARTSPNPPVGAVLVKKGRLIAVGHHKKAGGPHAEIVALRKAQRRAKGATLYVTLEPCAHHGRTPPCTEAVINAGVSRVVIGIRDPHRLVRGKGIQALRRKKVRVAVGVLQEEVENFYRPYRTFVTQQRPFVILKTAASLDGMIATSSGDSKWISGPEARRHSHQLRNRVDAILVGSETIMQDDPRLTTRLGPGRRGHDPLRVIIDSRLRTPPQAKVLRVVSEARTLIVTTEEATRMRERILTEEGAEVIRCLSHSDGRVDLEDMLRRLRERGVMSLLVEGGATVHSSFLREHYVDRLSIYVAMKLIGGDGVPMFSDLRLPSLSRAIRLKNTHFEPIGGDFWLSADL